MPGSATHAILLNHAGFPIPQLAIIYGVQRDTVSNWLDRWMSQREQALYDLQRLGRPPLLDEQDNASIHHRALFRSRGGIRLHKESA